MAKTQNLKPDTVLKNYWNDNEQFADLFNAVLFGGRQVFRPEELEDVDTEESSVLEHRDYAESIRASRDSIKVSKKSTAYGVELVMLGMESKSHIHYGMPLRIMGYDYGTYKKQYDSNARKYQKHDGLDDDEFLSKMKRTDKFIPVITIVVYYGEKPWDGAVSLHGMLEMILDKGTPRNETKEKVIKYAREHSIDKTVIMTVAGATNCKIDYNALAEKGDIDMCTLFEETRIEGEAKGIVEIGYDFGLSENDILERLQNKLKVSLQTAQGYLEMFGKQTV